MKKIFDFVTNPSKQLIHCKDVNDEESKEKIGEKLIYPESKCDICNDNGKYSISATESKKSGSVVLLSHVIQYNNNVVYTPCRVY